jgi:hypothetical protein
MTRPAKKTNRERCTVAGHDNASTVQKTTSFSAPFTKNTRVRARLCGLHRVGSHDVTSIAQEILIIKLKNQSECTQTANLGGENAGGLAKTDGTDGRDVLESSWS